MICILFHKFFNPAGRVDQLLLPGKEGVAGGTDFHLDFLIHGAGFHLVPAGALRGNFLIFRMDILFHRSYPPMGIFFLDDHGGPSDLVVNNTVP